MDMDLCLDGRQCRHWQIGKAQRNNVGEVKTELVVRISAVYHLEKAWRTRMIVEERSQNPTSDGGFQLLGHVLLPMSSYAALL